MNSEILLSPHRDLSQLSEINLIQARSRLRSIDIDAVAAQAAESMRRNWSSWRRGHALELPTGDVIEVEVDSNVRKPMDPNELRQLAQDALRQAVALSVRRLEGALRKRAIRTLRTFDTWVDEIRADWRAIFRSARLARRGLSQASVYRYEAYLKGGHSDPLEVRDPHDRACRILGTLSLEREIQGFLRYREVVVERGDVETPTVDLERHWDKYRTHWYQWVRARVTLPNRRAVSQARAAQVGVQGGMLTLLLDEEGRAVWMRRTKEGLQIEQGWMLQASNGSWVHASSLEEALQTLERRERAIRRAAEPRRRPMSRIRIDLRAALDAGLCRAGIFAWCDEHHVDPFGSATLAQIVNLDPHNPHIQQLAASYGHQVPA